MSADPFDTIREALGARCQSKTCCNMPAHLALDHIERRLAIRGRWLGRAVGWAQRWRECWSEASRDCDTQCRVLASARARIHSDICGYSCVPECQAITRALRDGQP